jgi:hypothetical protein
MAACHVHYFLSLFILNSTWAVCHPAGFNSGPLMGRPGMLLLLVVEHKALSGIAHKCILQHNAAAN